MTTPSSAHFSHMQKAISGVTGSNHPSAQSKIACTLVLRDGTEITASNLWLDAFNHMPPGPDGKIKIGNASPTIHAEVTALLLAIAARQVTEDASLYLTDPPCPNCVKMLIAAGITAIYIDSKGFRKDWYARRAEAFKALSMPMAGAAGVSLYILKRCKTKQEARVKCINAPYLSKDPAPLNSNEDTITFTMPNNYEDEKYNALLRPINTLIATSARDGTTIPQTIEPPQTPTARELVNLCGLQKLAFGDKLLTLRVKKPSELTDIINDYTAIQIQKSPL